MLPVRTTWLECRYRPAAAELDKICYANSLTLLELQTMLRRPTCAGAMAVINDRLIGYNIYEYHKDRYNILRLAVHPAFRRMDVGTRLVQHLIKKLNIRNRILIDVRETDLRSQLFYRELNFRAIHIERGGFENEDAYIMQYRKATEPITTSMLSPQPTAELVPHQW